MPVNDLYLLGILNSSVVEWYMKQISSTIQQGFIRFKRIYISQIPIPSFTPEQKKRMEELVKKCLSVNGQGSKVAQWSSEINELVYRLFDLSQNEKLIIEEGLETGKQHTKQKDLQEKIKRFLTGRDQFCPYPI